MRIINEEDKLTDSIEILLTKEEAEEFEGRLSSYCEIDWTDFDAGNVFGWQDKFEVKPSYLEFYIHTDKNLNSFSFETRKIILEDKI